MSLFVIICILLPIILFIAETMSLNDRTKVTLRVINTLVLTVEGGVVVFFVFLLSIFANRGEEYAGRVIFAFSAATVLFFVLLIGIVWHGYRKKAFLITIGSLFLICMSLGIGYSAWNEHIRNIPKVVVSDEILYKYNPHFSDNKLVRLASEPTVQFDNDPPVMDGATALYPVYAAFANALYPSDTMKAYSYWEGSLRCTKTDGAYESLIGGDADIIFVASPSKQQAEAAKEQGVELVFTPIGRECFVFFVNSKNKLDNITVEQIQQIYSGDLTHWDELGIHGLGMIRPFQREEGSGSQTYLLRMMGDIPVLKPEMEDVSEGMGGIIHKVADYKNYKNAIGYSFRFYATEMEETNQIKLLALDGIAPTKENIINNTYPLSGEFYAVTRSDCTEDTTKLIDWILSEQGQDIIDRTGYVRLN